ncbi:hypothetical protein NL323_29580, partial [Klebsiella pneumoniae]|nr:hypothetical protein [Klebsiella pneumoniae]
GVMLTGFVLVPEVGLVRTLFVLAVVAAAVGMVAVWRGQPVGKGMRVAVLVVGAATVLTGVLTPPQRLAQLLPGARSGEVVFYEEGRGGTV